MPNPSWTSSFKQAGVGRGIARAGAEIGDVLREKKKREEEIADQKRQDQVQTLRMWAPNVSVQEFDKKIAQMDPKDRPPDDVIALMRTIAGVNLYAKDVKNNVTQNDLNNVLSNPDIPKEEKIKFARSFAIDQKVPGDRIDDLLISYGLIKPEEKGGKESIPIDRTPHGTQARFLETTLSPLVSQKKDFLMSQIMSEDDIKKLERLERAYANLMQNPGKFYSKSEWDKILKDVKIIQDKVNPEPKKSKWDQFKVQ